MQLDGTLQPDAMMAADGGAGNGAVGVASVHCKDAVKLCKCK